MDLNKYLKELEYLVNIESGSLTPNGICKVAKFFTDKFRNIGFNVKTFNFNDNAGPCIEIRNNESDDIDVLLIGHMDTVFEEGTCRVRPFEIKDNIAYGPGVIDMKSCLLSGYYAIEKYLSCCENNLNICVAMNSDEEISSLYSVKWLEWLGRRSRFCIVMEHSRYGGSLVSQRKGYCGYCIEFFGEAIHAAGILEDGKSAVHEMSNWINNLEKLNNKELGTSINAGVVSGGTKSNIVAEYAKCELDTRFMLSSENEKIYKCLTQLKESAESKGIRVKVKRTEGYRAPMTINEGTEKLMKIVEKAGASTGVDVRWASAGGVSDGNFISAIGTPVIDGMGPYGEGAHSNNEYLYISSVEERINLLAATLKELNNL